MRVKLQNIIPFSKARSTLSELVDRVGKEQYFVISKQNQQKAVLVDPLYFSYLQEKAENEEVRKIEASLQDAFLAYAKKALKKKTVTEEEAYRLITRENLTW